ncbi:MAG: hypothetical protein AAF383_02260 [Cyanobacteria bacterium P01_A01_bin.83]
MKHYYQQFREYSINELGIKPQVILWAGAIGLGVLMSLPRLNQWNDSRQERTENIKEIKAKKDALEQELALEQHQELIASKRYKSCIPVVGEVFRNGTHYFTGINETTIARDRITGKALPPNTIICDANGMTARVGDNGRPTAFAFTGERDVIQSRLKRFRGSQYSNPVLSD